MLDFSAQKVLTHRKTLIRLVDRNNVSGVTEYATIICNYTLKLGCYALECPSQIAYRYSISTTPVPFEGDTAAC